MASSPQAPPSTGDPQTGSDPQTTASNTDLIIAIAVLLLITEDENDLADPISAILAPIRISSKAIRIALAVALTIPVWAGNGTNGGGATEATRELAFYFRAAFIKESARRVEEGLKAGRSPEDLKKQEARYFKEHLTAMSKRREAARIVDIAAKKHGGELGWYAIIDNRTSRECKEANGKNFDVTRVPIIGYPGAVHIHCRCRPGPPHRGASMLKAA